MKRVVSKTRTAEDFQNLKRNINGVPTRYLYSWGGKLSISFRFNKNIKAPQVGAFVLKSVVSKNPSSGAARLLKRVYLTKHER